MPDLDTSPILPGLPADSAGIMPALDCPGEMIPGQFGPMMRVLDSLARAKNSAVSFTGTPSVITTASGMFALIASSAAALVNFAGTKITETLASVAFMASRTEPNTEISLPPSKVIVSPAFLGLTPPTMFEPEFSMRCVCFMPSEPVMPWTMIFESLSRKIAIFFGPLPFTIRGV